MKTIPLTKGKVAVVDDVDFEGLSQFKWQALEDKHLWYAVRTIRVGKKRTSLLMHRAIIGCDREMQVDHRDRNGLNNLRNNLRVSTGSQNCGNARRKKNNKSGLKGVNARPNGKFRARIWIDGANRSLGDFDSADEAHAAYGIAAQEKYKEFARFE